MKRIELVATLGLKVEGPGFTENEMRDMLTKEIEQRILRPITAEGLIEVVVHYHEVRATMMTAKWEEK